MAISDLNQADAGVYFRKTSPQVWGGFSYDAGFALRSPAGKVHEEALHGENTESSHQATYGTIRLLHPNDTFSRKIGPVVRRLSRTVSAYDDRIEVLREQATREGYSLNHDSKAGFLEFFRRNPLINPGRLFLLENGNLRAVWKGDDGAHIGLQFLSEKTIQYVFFARRESSLPVSRASGRDTVDGVRRQIEAFDLDELIYA